MTMRSWLRRVFTLPAIRPVHTRQRRARPVVESLEDRAVPSASTIYVDANVAAHSTSPVRDGSTWARAFDNLQSALDLAPSRASQSDQPPAKKRAGGDFDPRPTCSARPEFADEVRG
jgi:hypothetical protein